MKPDVPSEKMNKKRRKAENAKQRGSWNGISPVTRVVPSGKRYTRKGRIPREQRNGEE